MEIDTHASLLNHEHAGKTNRRGWTAIACPNCQENRQYKSAFNDKFFKCFICGETCSLLAFAKKLGMNGAAQFQRRRVFVPTPPKPRWWHKEPQRWADRSLAHLQRVELWQEYRPFTLDNIGRWKLGVSVVPSTPCKHLRLTYVYMDGDRPTLRGRLLNCGCDPKGLKWVTAGGGRQALWGRDMLRPGATVVVCESPVDAMFAMQEDGDLVAVAGTAGAGSWNDEWTQAIAESAPALVVVAYDNDLQGQAQGETRRRLAREWRTNRPKAQRVPAANGPKVANKLLGAGLTTRLFDWENHPPGADIGWLLMASE